MELVEYQCHQSDRWPPATYVTNAFVLLSSLFLGFFLVKTYLRLRKVQEKFEWENTLLTSKLRNVFADIKELRNYQTRLDRIIDQLFTTTNILDVQILQLQSMNKKKPLTVTEQELKKMRWVIQMLVFSLHYGMPLHLDKVCLEEFMNREGHSVRTYAEKYIYPEVITTTDQMYDFGLDYLYGTGRAWERDVEIARKWLEKASRGGHHGADTQLRLLK